MFKQLFFALCLIALVVCQTPQIIDPLTPSTPTIEISGDDVTFVVASTQSSQIIGGERDIVLFGNGQGTAFCRTRSFVDTTSFGVDVYAVDNPPSNNPPLACGHVGEIQFDGTSDAAKQDIGSGLNGDNFNNRGFAFVLDIENDLEGQVTIEVISGSSVSQFTRTVSPSLGVFTTYEFPFSSFSDQSVFNSVDAVVIRIGQRTDLDITISTIGIIGSSAFGRVYSDCNCNLVQDQSTDFGVAGVQVSLTPSSGCSSSSGQTQFTDANGDYIFNGLEACTYTISVSRNDLCSAASSSQSVDLAVGQQSSIDFQIEQAGGILIPADITIQCTQDANDLGLTGSASVNSNCGSGSGDISSSDQFVNNDSSCTASATILRTWTLSSGGSVIESGVQTITIADSGIPATVSAPANVQVDCGSCTSVECIGDASGVDDCSTNVIISHVDSIDVQCNTDSCVRTETITRTFTADDGCNNTPLNTAVQIITVEQCTEDTTCDPEIIYEQNDCSEEDDDFFRPISTFDEDDRLPNVIDDDDVCECQIERSSSSSSATTITMSFALIAIVFAFLF